MLLLVFAVPGAQPGAQAQMAAETELYITGAWARATLVVDAAGGGMGGMDMTPEAAPEATEAPMGEMGGGMGGSVSAAYMTIANPGDAPVRLVAAAAPVAAVVEIHETIVENEVARMQPVEGILVPAGESVTLAPGGLHIMLVDLLRDLPAGGAISLMLTFELLNADGSSMGETHDVLIAVPVLESAPPATDFVLVGGWVRATATAAPMGGMDMTPEAAPEAAPEATEAPMGGGMGGMMGGSVSAGYFMLLNQGADDRLVSASVPVEIALVTELHETVVENEIAAMRPLLDGVVLPAGARLVFEPGGMHVMLIDVQVDLVPGDAVPLTLMFESGARLVTALPVRESDGTHAGR